MRRIVLITLGIAALVAGLAVGGRGAASKHRPTAKEAISPQLRAARRKIQHVVVIMQENRSFDSYFGT